MSESIIERLLAEGLPGVIIIILCGVIIFLYREITKRDKFIADLQEKRIECATDTVKALGASATALEILTDTIRDRRAGVA